MNGTSALSFQAQAKLQREKITSGVRILYCQALRRVEAAVESKRPESLEDVFITY